LHQIEVLLVFRSWGTLSSFNWANGENKMENLLLLPIMDIIREVRNNFVDVYFQHVFRELDEKAYKLSKEALLF
jgi:hypothetical protein